jgi:hypothetical protein
MVLIKYEYKGTQLESWPRCEIGVDSARACFQTRNRIAAFEWLTRRSCKLLEEHMKRARSNVSSRKIALTLGMAILAGSLAAQQCQ